MKFVCNRFYKCYFRKLSIRKEGNNWSAYLPSSCLAYNSSPHSVTGFSPFYLTFLRNPNLPFNNELLKVPESNELSSATDGNIKRAWAKAGDRIRYRQKLAAHRYNQDHRFVIYLTGDLVMLKSTKSHKFGTKYTGPYIVLRRLKGRTLVYKIQEIKYPYKRIIVNARRLKLYYHPEIRFYEELEGENGLINPTRRMF